MAKITDEPDEKLEADLERWLDGRPAIIREMTKARPPWLLYRLKNTKHRVTIYSYHEDGTVTVNVSGDYNALTFARRVFGTPLEDLEECDLPAPGERVGVMITDEKEIRAYLSRLRKRPQA